MRGTNIYPKGSVIAFEAGRYSDYRVVGFLIAIEEINLKTKGDEFVAGRVYYDYDLADFPSWLIAKGLALPVEHSTVHIGAYEGFNLDEDH